MDIQHTAGVLQQSGCPHSHPCTAHSGLPPCCAGSSTRKRQVAGSALTARNVCCTKNIPLDIRTLQPFLFPQNIFHPKLTPSRIIPEMAHAANAPVQARTCQLSLYVKSFLIAHCRPYNSKIPCWFTVYLQGISQSPAGTDLSGHCNDMGYIFPERAPWCPCSNLEHIPEDREKEM